MSNLFDQCNDIYKTVMIVAQRAKQLIEPQIIIEEIDKPMVVALEEYLSGELEWRKPEEDKPESDEE